jgi:predicted metal-dependent hydrolase
MSIPFRALFFKRTSEPVTIDVAHEGEVFAIRLRGHPRARRYTLRIHSTTREVVLSMPPRGSVKQATEFANKHGAWIAARLQKLPKPAPFSDGTIIPLRGIDHRIEHRSGARGTAWTEVNAAGEHLLCVAGAAPHVPRRVRDYLKREAKADLEVASKAAAAALGVAVKRVAIRDQSSRWGSCSTTGVLSYSWRLILAPPLVLEYLAAHEVAHLVEMNHSRAFWRVVARICPDMDRAKTWLDAHGTALHRYGMKG